MESNYSFQFNMKLNKKWRILVNTLIFWSLESDMDAKENKEQFSLGFKDVQESFYDLCSKLEKTQTGSR